MITLAIYNKKRLTHIGKCCVALFVLLLFVCRGLATENVININSQMPSREVSVVARQSVVLQPGFRATGSAGTFVAKVGSINSVCPTITLADGSGSVLQPVASEKANTSRSSVKITTPTQPIADATSLRLTNSMVEEKYFDGLGRSNITVQKNFSREGQDLATLVNYDEYGSLSNQWLPAPVNSGSRPDADIVAQQAKNYYNDLNPYFSFDESSITYNRTFRPGTIYRSQDKSLIEGYYNEVLSNNVLKQYVVDENNITVSELQDFDVQQSIDEDGHTTNVFTNFLGQSILKQKISNGESFNTYYVYDDLGRLSYVLSPEASDRMSVVGTSYSRSTIDNQSSILAQYAFAYTYDEAGRCVAKKIPGKAWEYIIYDQANQIAFTQDGNQRSSGQWTYYKYDSQGRSIQSGTTVLSNPDQIRTTYASIKAEENYQQGVGYTSLKPLGTDSKLLIQRFYDSYDFLMLSAYSAIAGNLGYSGLQGLKYSNIVDNVDIALLGKPTGGWVTTLENTTTPPTLLSALYYDDKGRVIQSNASNQLKGYDKDSYTYNFNGQVLTNVHNHSSLIGSVSTSVTETYRMFYDRVGRTTSVRHTLYNQPEIVMDSILYDATGRPVCKTLHGGMQTVNYAFNLQGQLKSINSLVFAETLMYNDPDPNGVPLYNGSIASVQYGNGAGYRYTYDGLNRLKIASYTDISNPTINNGTFSETIDSYDKNGNIQKLTRSGLALDYLHMYNGVPPVVKHDIDQLSMTYAGNQVKKTVDANNVAQYLGVGKTDFADIQDVAHPDVAEYLYDVNGNCTADLNKGIAWTAYNYLNRPQTIQMTNGNKTSYTYDAAGTKLRADYYTAQSGIQVPLGDYTKELGKNTGVIDKTNRTDYCGRYVYIDGVLARILTNEGYVQVSGANVANWRYAYNLTDHLGSTRAQLLSDAISNVGSKAYTVASTAEYYPSGMEISRSSTSTSGTNPYLYGGNEIERMHGLNLYEFPYRWYDYAVPGFTTPDPLAEKRYSESPYSYCGGDPVNRIDPTGLIYFASPNNMAMTCLSESDLRTLGYDANAGSIKYDGVFFNRKGETVYFSEKNGAYDFTGDDWVGAPDCRVYSKESYGQLLQNPNLTSSGKSILDIKDGISAMMKLKALSSLNGPNYLDIQGELYRAGPPPKLSELPTLTLNGVTFPDIKPEMNIEPLPGINMAMSISYIEGLRDGVNSIGEAVLDPLNTLNNMGNAILNPIETYNELNKHVFDYVSAIRNGDGQKVAYQTGNFLGMLVGGEAVGGAASRLADAGKAASLSRAAVAAETSTQGFKSFSSFKRAMGPAGEGQAWHHIVEQNPANIAKFGPEAIHNTGNVIKLPHGAGSIHAKISGFYSSKMPGTNMLVRDYVKTLPFQEQYQFGLDALKRFGY